MIATLIVFTVIWDKPYGHWNKKLDNANIQVINLKARNRHYVIGEEGSRWVPFAFGAPAWTNYPCWNHWPVGQLPNDGRVAAAPDRPSSSCPGTLYPVKHKLDDITMSARDLYGMTDQPVTTLVTLARSWNFPAQLKTDGLESLGYDKNQRSYVLALKTLHPPAKVELTLAGNAQSPVLNPALIMKNWGESDVELTLNGHEISQGKTFRIGHVPTLEGTDLVIWMADSSG